MDQEVSDLLHETRQIESSDYFKNNANIKQNSFREKACSNYQEFWAEEAKKLDWFEDWSEILDWQPPYAKWFINGKINASYNCVDRHIKNNKGHLVAFYWEGELGDERIVTYQEIYDSINKISHTLSLLGVKKGDRAAIYMPMVPESIMTMLACARMGVIHTVVFAGFSPESLKDRILDANVKWVFTSDGSYRRGKVLPLKDFVDEAIQDCPCVEKVFVLKRCHNLIQWDSNKNIWFDQLLEGKSVFFEPIKMDSEDLLFILYTSGTTGKPKGIMHTTGGYLTGVHSSTEWVFDIKPEDVFWCTADIGWITGHSYIVYGPMSHGLTQVIYEGSPDYPKKNRFWQLIEKYKVSIFYTAPTAIRAFMNWGDEYIKNSNLESLRLLGSVGEPINPEAWMWYYEKIGQSKCPIVDTWWQTETGMIMIAPLVGFETMKPGSANKPLPGINAILLNKRGDQIQTGGGLLAINQPWPSMLRGIYGDSERFQLQYWNEWSNDVYFTGDGAKIDQDGYFWLLGRVDDVMNISGHRIGTMEVESALVDHPDVVEAAVVGIIDKIKGQAIAAFVTISQNKQHHHIDEEGLKQHVVKKIGSIAKPKFIIFTNELPKTRSGKIMRRLLRDIAEGRVVGDVTTLADSNVVDKLKTSYQEKESN